MKFEKKYPDAIDGDEVIDYRVHKLSGEKRPCFWCGYKTLFAEVNYGGRICSDECLVAVDEDYNRAYELSSSLWFENGNLTGGEHEALGTSDLAEKMLALSHRSQIREEVG